MSRRGWWWTWWTGASISYWYGYFAGNAFFRGLGTFVWLIMGSLFVFDAVRWWRAYGRHRCEVSGCRHRSGGRVHLTVKQVHQDAYVCRRHLIRLRAVAEVSQHVWMLQREARNN